jgi:hypothetical protein
MSNVGIFYDRLEYFMAIWYNLWPFGIVCGHLLYFFQIWNVWTKKNLATLVGVRVTRFGEFSPNGRLFTLGKYCENYCNSTHLLCTFSTVKIMH